MMSITDWAIPVCRTVNTHPSHHHLWLHEHSTVNTSSMTVITPMFFVVFFIVFSPWNIVYNTFLVVIKRASHVSFGCQSKTLSSPDFESTYTNKASLKAFAVC